MTLYDDYRNTDYLDDVSFIAGTEFTFYFPLYNKAGGLMSINNSTMAWALSPYGQPETLILSKTASGYDANTYMVQLTEADTLDLGGVYLQQMRITDSTGKKIRPAQGVVVIRKAIPIT